MSTLTVAQACTGQIDGPGTSPGGIQNGGSGGNGVSKPTPALCQNRVVEPGAAPMRLLTREQYLNTVRDLVGDVAGLDAVFADSRSASALGIAPPDVGQPELQTYQDAADKVASAVSTPVMPGARFAPSCR